ncbi:B-lymphocyte antigen CD19 [Spea bombifrons]|uniref:B-lymphocyte antigen CD19 n=1 Tax=Spea bombifrons TaxID=233779 RepID=UPI00234B000A|nr:B-lymphocyte antigen CD19 [Spea bombifrons]
MMPLWLLILCTCCPVSTHLPEDRGNITVPAAGNALLPCGSAPPPPFTLRWLMEEAENDTRGALTVTSEGLEFHSSSLMVIKQASREDSGSYSCSVDNKTENYVITRVQRTGVQNLGVDPENETLLSCEAPRNWTHLSWYRGGQVILEERRGRGASRSHVTLVGSETYLLITSVTPEDAGVYHCHQNGLNSSVRLVVTQRTGLEMFFSERYWIIVAVALSYLAFCGAVMSFFVCTRRGKSKQQPVARFYKVSSVARNLYTNAANQMQDTERKPADGTYQNVAGISLKRRSKECYSDCSSFMENSSGDNYEIADEENTQDGASYLEPNATAEDQISDGGCYEIPDGEDVEDGEHYENASEAMKETSEGSQSYEDMMGSMRAPNTNHVGEEREEDTDSYENMQTPAYPHSQSTHGKERPAATENRGKVFFDGPTELLVDQYQPINKLRQEDGDFYLSFEKQKIFAGAE